MKLLGRRQLRQYHQPLTMASTGWVAINDRAGVMLIMDNMDWPENETLDAWEYRNHQFIPRRCITRIEWLESTTAPAPGPGATA